MAKSLEESKKGPDWSSTNKYLLFGAKITKKISPADPEDL